MAALIPHLLWTFVLLFTNMDPDGKGTEWMAFIYFWTMFSWFTAIISQIFTMLAASWPNYFRVTAFAWLEVAHG